MAANGYGEPLLLDPELERRFEDLTALGLIDLEPNNAQLLASGMPKRQIAWTLGINRKSINRELASIAIPCGLFKLD